MADENENTVEKQEPIPPHKSSGMFSMMKELGMSDEEIQGKNNGDNLENETNLITTRIFNEDEKANIKKIVDKVEKEKQEEFIKLINSLEDKDNIDTEKFKNYISEDDIKTLQEKQSGEEPVKNKLNKKLEELSTNELIEEIKKNQRLVSERNVELDKLRKELSEKSDGTQISEAEFLKDVEGLKTDFRANYDKFREKYNLPTPDLIVAQYGNDSAQARLKQYQESELRSKIEEKYGLAEGEFEYDPKEASEAGTPSSDWDYYTSVKRQELIGQQQKLIEKENLMKQKLVEQDKLDREWLAKNLFDNNIEAVNDKISEVNKVAQQVSKNEKDLSEHPFATKNIIRGYFFDELVKKQVDKAVKELHKQYSENGIRLPKNMDNLPTDPDERTDAKNKLPEFSEDSLNISPMLRSMNISLHSK